MSASADESTALVAAAAPRLQYATPPEWATSQRAHLAELLVEQAHLEKKAAAAATTFLFRAPSRPDVQHALSRLAREELVHFERTLRLCAARGIAFATLAPCPYAERLKAVLSPKMPLRLADELLVAAAIEARSCERMRLLGGELAATDPEAAAFYGDLVEAEARHGDVYRAIAELVAGRDAVAARWEAVAAHEAAVLRALPWSPRLHGGAPAPAAAR